MTRVKDFDIPITVEGKVFSSHIDTLSWSRGVIRIKYKSGATYRGSKLVSLYDFLDLIASIDRDKSYGKAMNWFLKWKNLKLEQET